ncbi:MAG: Mg/Co transporter [Candidatus Falkowbacteria bacterium GW2011_GWA2_39_24]|uniref:Mg/Co transporter n=1 Tax=Candidatus Falkowbacteria bacterium GW2011_GWA2_39_24 TaxID=1618634 RepID=A0A0G0NBT4_9BACT|nr:MAG: Mg/Co transporter [Candidatus Falkowbacteria bacterium GW2011_GWA2_39_24]
MSSWEKISSKIQRLVIDNPKTSYKIEWFNIVNAGKTEIDYLRKNFQFDLQHLKASSGKTLAQRPDLMEQNDYVFLILHFPILNNGNIEAGEIDFFIGHQYLITLHNGNIPVLNDFFQTAKKDQTMLKAYQAESSAILLADILDKLIKSVYYLLDDTSKDINKVERIIFAQQQKQAVALILNLRRNIINIRRILQNHKNILKKLTEMKSTLVDDQEIKQNYERLVEHSKRIWEILENQKEMVEVLNNTNESLLNNTLSNIMKTLTIFSVIVFPLTLLAAIFGMNAINMPFVNQPFGFWYIIIIMLTGSLIMLLIFRKKKWL